MAKLNMTSPDGSVDLTEDALDLEIQTAISTLAALNAKVSDATLIDTGDSRLSDARIPTSHGLGGAEHSADTLANLNSKVSDATLIDTADSRLSDNRTDGDAIHDNVAGEIAALTLVTALAGDHVIIEDASDSNNKKRVAASDFLGGGGGTPSIVHLNTHNGFGSDSNNKISRWTNVVTNTGSDLTLTQSAAAGDKITIDTTGFYTVMCQKVPSGVKTISLSVNASDLTILTDALAIAERLQLEVNNSGSFCPLALVRYFTAGDIIRNQDGAASALAGGEFLRIEGPI